MNRPPASVIKHAQLAEDTFVLPHAESGPRACDAQAAATLVDSAQLCEPVPRAATACVAPLALVEDTQRRDAASYQEGLEAGLLQGRAEAEAEQKDLRHALKREMASAQECRDALDVENAELASRVSALDHRTQLLDDMLRAIAHARTEIFSAAEDDLLAICFELAAKTFETSVMHPDALRSMVRRATDDLGRQATITVRLHPQDLDWLSQTVAEDKPDHAVSSTAIAWVADSAVALGGCIVQGEQATLDARLEQQLNALRERLTSLRSHRGEGRLQASRNEAQA
jgi:flagellar assembly protein FliH